MPPAGATGPCIANLRGMNRRIGALFRAVIYLLGALVSVVAARQMWVSTALMPEAFAVEFIALVVAAAIARAFGIALPGKGFTSIILGVTLYGIVNHGWPTTVIVSLLGLPIGDGIVRRQRPQTVALTTSHLIVGTVAAGLIYEFAGGIVGSGVLQLTNLGPLILLCFVYPVIINGTFYTMLGLDGAFLRADLALIARWEGFVYFLSVVLTFSWTAVLRAPVPVGAKWFFATILALSMAAFWYIIRVGVRADELRMVHGLSRVIAAGANLTKSLQTIQDLTAKLVPWEQMGLARYLPETHEMEIFEDTSSDSFRGHRFHADSGITGEALRVRGPVVASGLHRQEVVLPDNFLSKR